MKKVGVVSCYFQQNYGSMLQALATQMVLDKLGYDNETINISGIRKELRKRKIRYFIKASLTSGILLSKIGRAKNVVVRKFKKTEYVKNIEQRSSAFERFENKYFKLSKVSNSMSELSNNCNMYRTVLVGSDQLWLPGNIAADYYTLNFVPDSVNTVAYATSFGQSVLPRDSRRLAKVFLNRIRHISVREESGAKLVKEISDRNVPVVCDPTLLLNSEDWEKIQEKQTELEYEYIFVYFLGNNKLHRDFVTRLKSETGLRVVCLPHVDEFVKEDEICSDMAMYDIDPCQFLNLIKNAKYICTDSFHCSVFSILFKKQFFTFRRFGDKNKQSTNNRLDTLFNMTGIVDRLFLGDENISDVLKIKTDYEAVNARLTRIREDSYKYLVAALEDKGSTDCD